MNNNLHPGSTMTPETVRTNQVITEQTNTDNLIINGNSITGVSFDPEDDDYNKLSSSFVLSSVKNKLNKEISELNYKVDINDFKSVLSDPIIDKYFYGPDWVKTDNISFDNSKAIYINNELPNSIQAILRIPTDVIFQNGKYFFNIKVDELPSGFIKITNEKQDIIYTITSEGSYQFETIVENSSIAFFQIYIGDMNIYDKCIISLCSIHHVRDDFDIFMEYKIREYLQHHVNSLYTYVKTNIENLTTLVNDINTNFSNALLEHKLDFDNPHRVQKNQIIE